MNGYWIKTTAIIKKIFSSYIWEIPNTEKIIYLTFDDGPTPQITDWILSQLKEYDAKATFFCIGKNIKENPELFKKILIEEHAIGNHTFNHLNGWKTSSATYLENTLLCADAITELIFEGNNTKLFRPPYGKIKPFQARVLQKKGYKIIMWDVLSADFDTQITPEKCLENVLKNVEPGSIIVFHDSTKAFKNLEYCLPKTLKYLKENKYKCDKISFD